MDNYTASAVMLSAITNGLDYDTLTKDTDLVSKCFGLNADAINDLIVAKYGKGNK